MFAMTKIFNITTETESRVLKKNTIILKSKEWLDHSNGNGYILDMRIHASLIKAKKRTRNGRIRKVKCPRICEGWQQLQKNSRNEMWGNRWDGGQYKKNIHCNKIHQNMVNRLQYTDKKKIKTKRAESCTNPSINASRIGSGRRQQDKQQESLKEYNWNKLRCKMLCPRKNQK